MKQFDLAVVSGGILGLVAAFSIHSALPGSSCWRKQPVLPSTRLKVIAAVTEAEARGVANMPWRKVGRRLQWDASRVDQFFKEATKWRGR